VGAGTRCQIPAVGALFSSAESVGGGALGLVGSPPFPILSSRRRSISCRRRRSRAWESVGGEALGTRVLVEDKGVKGPNSVGAGPWRVGHVGKGAEGPDSVGVGPSRVGHVGTGVGSDTSSEILFLIDQRDASLCDC